MRRKVLSILLMITLLSGMIFILTGCGAENNSKDNKSSNTENKEQETKLVDVVSVGDYVN